MIFKFKKKILIAVCATFLITGCSIDENASTRSINSMDAVADAREEDQARVEQLKITREDEMKRHYGNNLYFEDFSKEEDELNKKFAEKFEEIYEEKSNQLRL